jgi:myo-inositol 2-dehydrogenase / D-chiro-inositol 1-dehydrogenase
MHTDSKLTINLQPQANLVNIHGPTGVCREVPAHYYDRFEQAFVCEANEFTACCLDNTKLPMKLASAVQAVRIASALQESVRTGCKIWFDETSRRIARAAL